MKKILALVAALLLTCLCFGCGGDKAHAGEWYLTAAEYEGLLTEPEVFGLSASLSLKKGGTGRLTIGEDSYAISSWFVNDGEVSLQTLDGPVEGRIMNGFLILTFEDSMRLYFAKEGTNAPELILLDRDAFRTAYDALVAAGEAMPAD